ncbi:MAG: hypothetical protein ACYTFG_08590 [Planctomycetota bacterium]|jgi:hypothetical protein
MKIPKFALGLVAVLAAVSGCTSGPSPGSGRPISIGEFDDAKVAATAAHMDLGLTAEAIMAEQIGATAGFRLVLPEKGLERRRLAWERKAENTAKPIEVVEGETR